jgi:hypothetical protein
MFTSARGGMGVMNHIERRRHYPGYQLNLLMDHRQFASSCGCRVDEQRNA